jgi:ribosome-binding ATPase YchF (GTP1/OBG family)
MRIALLGLAGSGKTTLLSAISDKPVPRTPGAVQTETHVHVVKVRDPRLERCRDIFQPKKFTPAGLEVWDPPGLPTGSGEADREKRTRLLASLREADAYVLVLRAFTTDSYPYDPRTADPARDLARLVDELVLADLVVAEGRAHKLRQNLERGARSAEEDRRELAVLEKCLARIEGREGRMADLRLDDQDEKRIRGFQFFGRKPCLVLVNGAGAPPPGLAEGGPIPFRAVVQMDAQVEAELAAMDPADRPAFMAEFGISEPATDRFVHEVYRAVGLLSFFTVGEDEVRAWTIRSGDDAVTAAGKIHTDLAKGFVRAEVFAYEELADAGSMRELKARGKIRLEPKDYVVKDGDIVHIRSAI